MTEQDFKQGLALLVAAHPAVPMDEPRVKVYWMALADLEAHEWTAAVLRCLRELKFFPSVAELRSAAAPRITLRAARMYDRLLALKRGSGRYDGFPTLATVGERLGEAAMEAYQVAGGPSGFADAHYRQDMTWVRKAFLEEYATSVTSGTTDAPALPPDPRFQQIAADLAQSIGNPGNGLALPKAGAK